MLKKTALSSLLVLTWGLAAADSHTEEAARQAAEAAGSAGDSKAVIEHATEALKHISEAKAKVKDAETARHLNAGEADLLSALKNAEKFNSDAAARDARSAKDHLDAASRR